MNSLQAGAKLTGVDQWIADKFRAEDLLASVNAGIKARNEGHMDAAEGLFKKILGAEASHPFAHFELAFLYSITNRHMEALGQFETLLRHHPNDARAMKGLASTASYLGARGKAFAALKGLPLTDSTADLSTVLDQFRGFVEEFSHEDIRSMLSKLEIENKYLHCTDLCEEILAAARQKVPFSLIRLGDGEGTRVKIGLKDEVNYRELYRHCRRALTDIWFTSDFQDPDGQFDLLSLELPEVIKNASVLGIPYQSWLAHEHKIASITGVTSLTNLIRLISSFPSNKMPSLCVQNIHFALSGSSLFERLFREDCKFGVITCHSALGYAIERRFGVPNVATYKIPGEGAYKTLLEDQADKRFHFPSVFNDIRSSIKSQCLSGNVILVAAGYLGKFYCDDIKRSGGIGIDIGSIADGWMGKNTRPGMSDVISIK